ncbi:MAG TPA: hypothetical protein DIS90_13575 [Cytophagales bacterium]|nr:hypothetical protein [Cytophagales bacterium]
MKVKANISVLLILLLLQIAELPALNAMSTSLLMKEQLTQATLPMPGNESLPDVIDNLLEDHESFFVYSEIVFSHVEEFTRFHDLNFSLQSGETNPPYTPPKLTASF